MTEIVAAHLERVAREVHDAIERGYDKWDREGQCGEPSCGCVTVYIEREIKPILAAALAACAREEAKLWRKHWHEYDCVDGIHAGHGGKEETCEYCERFNLRIAALERAVGEKP